MAISLVAIGSAIASAATTSALVAAGGFWVGATAIGVSAMGAAIIGSVVAMGVSYLGNAIIGGEDAQSSAGDFKDPGILVNKAVANSPLVVIYGERRVGSVVPFKEWGGTNNKYFYMIHVLCEGEIDSINSVYFFDEEITNAMLDGSGNVTSGRYSGKARIVKYLGTDTQAADPDFVSELDNWTTAHQGKGVAYCAIRLEYDREVYQGGTPTITFDVKGKKVYDPRDASTAWSNNPILCVRDYLTNERYGRGIAASVIDDSGASSTFQTEANFCETTVTVAGNDIQYYTCDGIVNPDQGDLDIISKLLTSCRGMLIYSGGKYKSVIDRAITPETFEFNEDNIVGAWEFSPGGKATRFNRYKVNFFNPDRSWQDDSVYIDNQTYRTADNDLLMEREIYLPFTAHRDRSSMIGEYNLKQSRQQLMCSFTAMLKGMRCEVGDVVPITHSTPGWSGKYFRILGIKLKSDDTVTVTAREYDASVYSNTITAGDATPNTNLPDPWTIAPPTAMAWFSDDLYSTGTGTLSWTAAADAYVDHYEVEYMLTGGASWVSHYAVTGDSTERIFDNLSTGEWNFRIRAVNGFGVRSNWVYLVETIAIPAVPNVSNLLLVDGVTTTTFAGSDAKFAWDATTLSDRPGRDGAGPWFDSYKIEILKDAAVVHTAHTQTPEFVYSFSQNTDDGGPDRSFSIKVYIQGDQGQLSGTPASLSVSNPAPTMSGFTPTITDSFKGISIDWSAWSTTDIDLKSFKVYVDTVADPSAMVAELPGEERRWFCPNLTVGDNYKVKIMPVDDFGDGTPSEIANGTPLILSGVDVDVELSGSITMSDSDSNTPAAMLTLYDRITASGGLTYTLVGVEKFISYVFGLEDYIDKVIIHCGSTPAQAYIRYSSNGTDWSYLEAESDHTLTSAGNLVAGDSGTAPTNYWQLAAGLNVAKFPQRITAKYCELVMVGSYTTTIFELVFVREVIAEQVVTDNLSAISAKLGTVYSDNYVLNVSGFMIDGAGGIAEFNDITMTFNSPTDIRTQLNVEDGATVGATWGVDVVGSGEFLDPATLAGRWSFAQGGNTFPELTGVLGKTETYDNSYTHTVTPGNIGNALQIGTEGVKLCDDADSSPVTYPNQTWVCAVKAPSVVDSGDRIITKDASDYLCAYMGEAYTDGKANITCNLQGTSEILVDGFLQDEWHVFVISIDHALGTITYRVFHPDGTWDEVTGTSPATANARAVAIGGNSEGDWNASNLDSSVLTDALFSEVRYYRATATFSQAYNIARLMFDASGGIEAIGLADSAEAAAKNYTDANFVLTTTHTTDLADIQNQIDGNITSWFYDDVPTLVNLPASDWTTDIEKDNHLGDLYYDNLSGYAYRFRVIATVYSWQKLSDSDITTALANAQTAQDTADSKRRVFVVTPTVPYDVGDLWDNGSTVKRSTADQTSAYNAGDWTEIANYTTNTDELTDGAGLGDTANWSGVVDDDGNLPDDNANVTYQLPSDENLIAYWSLDGSGSDNSGNGHHGTLMNAPTFVPGIAGQGIRMVQDSHHYVDLPDDIVDVSSAFSISMWATVTGTATNSNPRFLNLLETNGDGISFCAYQNGRPLLHTTVAGVEKEYAVGSADALIADTMYHIVATSDDNQNIQIFIDSEQINISSASIILGLASGIGVNAPTSYTHDGDIDEVRLYSKVLTEDEVKALYKNPSGSQSAVATDTYNVNGSPAATVQTNAANAIAAANNMSADGTFSVQEKAVWRVQWPGMLANHDNIITQATTYGIHAETVFTDYTSAKNVLLNYLNITHDIWAATPTDTAITGDLLQLNTTNFYDKMQIAVNRLADYQTARNHTGTVQGQTVFSAGYIGTNLVRSDSVEAGSLEATHMSGDQLDVLAAKTGSLIVDETLDVTPGGIFKSGQTAYATGTGWWQGNVAGVPKASFGIGNTKGFGFDGSNFNVYGDIIGTGNIVASGATQSDSDIRTATYTISRTAVGVTTGSANTAAITPYASGLPVIIVFKIVGEYEVGYSESFEAIYTATLRRNGTVIKTLFSINPNLPPDTGGAFSFSDFGSYEDITVSGSSHSYTITLEIDVIDSSAANYMRAFSSDLVVLHTKR